MASEMRPNSGTIDKNTNKETENQPDLRGRALIDGKKYWINGFKKTNGNDGTIFYSLSFRPMDEAQMDPVTGAGQADSPGF